MGCLAGRCGTSSQLMLVLKSIPGEHLMRASSPLHPGISLCEVTWRKDENLPFISSVSWLEKLLALRVPLWTGGWLAIIQWQLECANFTWMQRHMEATSCSIGRLCNQYYLGSVWQRQKMRVHFCWNGSLASKDSASTLPNSNSNHKFSMWAECLEERSRKTVWWM